jgi:NAD(P)H-dependent FMN reductase
MTTIAIVVGSHRPNSQSRKVASCVHRRLLNHCRVASTWMMDLAELALPMWDEGVWGGTAPWDAIWAPLSQRLHATSAVVIVTPEWGGMVPAALKNFFLLCAGNELAHKAGLIVSVSAGGNGAYPVAELRMSSYKNTRLCYVPDHVIVRNVESVLNTQEVPQDEEDARIRSRLNYSLDVFLAYATALDAVRADPAVDLSTYPYGM